MSNFPLYLHVQELIDCYRKGDFPDVGKKLDLLRERIGSHPTEEVAAFKTLLNYVEKKLLGSSSLKDSLKLVSSDSNFFKLLRDEYAKIQFSDTEVLQKNIEEKPEYIFNLIEGARVTLYWGQRLKQVLGRDRGTGYIADYEFVSEALKHLKARDEEKKVNIFQIVTPTYNSSKHIDRTILSVVSQEGPFHIHYHIQDGGSSDGTVKKLLQWKALLSIPNSNLIRCQGVTFTFQSEKDGGMYEAINKGFVSFKALEDSICGWINSDDIFTSGAFATAWQVFANNTKAFWLIGATCGCDEYLSELSQIPLHFPQEVIARGLCDGIHWRFIQQEGSFWRNSLWSATGGLNSSLKYCGDWDLWRRFAQLVDPVHIEWPLGRFRIHPGQLTVSIEQYYQEIDSAIPKEIRWSRLDALRNSGPFSVQMVRRPNCKGQVLKSERVVIKSKYVGFVNNEQTNKTLRQMLKCTSEPPLKILTVCSLAHGGAGVGTLRRIEALRNIGIDARLISLVTHLADEHVGRLVPTLDGLDVGEQNKVWHYLWSNIQSKVMGRRGFRGHELFSLTETVVDMRQLQPLVDEMDIVHLHWIVGMLDYKNMPTVLTKKPIVWTTADMNPFTGGCHYSEGCEGFKRECANCPMLGGKSSLAHEAWKMKKKAYQSLDITLVCPSEYIASIARQSSLLGEREIQVIPNAYPIDRIIPIDRSLARKKFDLPQDKKLILFGADSLANLRKGGDLFHLIVEMLIKHPFANDIEIVSFGYGNLNLPIKINSLGRLKEDQLSAVYSAVDLFVSLSREDVGPMTVVESLLCGTPVVGFSVGVLPDVVIHEKTGYCAEPFWVEDILKGIRWGLSAVQKDSSVGKQCRSSAVQYANPRLAAQRHKRLYVSKMGKRNVTIR